jgi:hypothetical protein
MFDKKLPCYFDHDRDPENYYPWVNGISKQMLTKFKTEVIGCADESETDNMPSWYSLGKPQPFFIDVVTNYNENFRSYEEGREPFIYPIHICPALTPYGDILDERSVDFWTNYIHINSDVLYRICKRQNGKICLYNNWEAWSVGSYKLITDIMIEKYGEEFGLSKWHFIIASGNENLKINGVYPHTTSTPLMNLPWHPSEVVNEVVEKIKNKEPRENKFICLNRVTKSHRLAAVAELWDDREDGIITAMCVHYGNPGIDHFAELTRKEVSQPAFPQIHQMQKMHTDSDWNNYVKDQVLSVGRMRWHYDRELQENYPQSFEKFKEHKLIDMMPILMADDISPIVNPVPDPLTQKFFDSSLNIVTETYGLESQQSIQLTDKIWKPMLHFQPFVVIGSKGHLSALHQRGFKTFNTWIDETYDTIRDDQKRMTAAITSAKEFYKRSKEEIAEDLADMLGVLLHNNEHYRHCYESHRINAVWQVALNLNYCRKES